MAEPKRERWSALNDPTSWLSQTQRIMNDIARGGCAVSADLPAEERQEMTTDDLARTSNRLSMADLECAVRRYKDSASRSAADYAIINQFFDELCQDSDAQVRASLSTRETGDVHFSFPMFPSNLHCMCEVVADKSGRLWRYDSASGELWMLGRLPDGRAATKEEVAGFFKAWQRPAADKAA